MQRYKYNVISEHVGLVVGNYYTGSLRQTLRRVIHLAYKDKHNYNIRRLHTLVIAIRYTSADSVDVVLYRASAEAAEIEAASAVVAQLQRKDRIKIAYREIQS